MDPFKKKLHFKHGATTDLPNRNFHSTKSLRKKGVIPAMLVATLAAGKIRATRTSPDRTRPGGASRDPSAQSAGSGGPAVAPREHRRTCVRETQTSCSLPSSG